MGLSSVWLLMVFFPNIMKPKKPKLLFLRVNVHIA